jgi:hypothetical protein
MRKWFALFLIVEVAAVGTCYAVHDVDWRGSAIAVVRWMAPAGAELR